VNSGGVVYVAEQAARVDVGNPRAGVDGDRACADGPAGNRTDRSRVNLSMDTTRLGRTGLWIGFGALAVVIFLALMLLMGGGGGGGGIGKY
jgi:hypothetical protein